MKFFKTIKKRPAFLFLLIILVVVVLFSLYSVKEGLGVAKADTPTTSPPTTTPARITASPEKVKNAIQNYGKTDPSGNNAIENFVDNTVFTKITNVLIKEIDNRANPDSSPRNKCKGAVLSKAVENGYRQKIYDDMYTPFNNMLSATYFPPNATDKEMNDTFNKSMKEYWELKDKIRDRLIVDIASEKYTETTKANASVFNEFKAVIRPILNPPVTTTAALPTTTAVRPTTTAAKR